ncbi:response regulator [Longimicrobium sp.]|uniref:response regulator n=1 Tax=Longimicrobium sp. TaxID=2029185 RepID=UPI003B3B3AE9
MPSRTLLLVDANEDSRLIYAAALRHHGLSVVAHECSASAVDLARTHQPRVIVLGLSYASGPGWGALRALKEDPVTASIPIVAVSTTGLVEHRERAMAMGCAAFLVKPLPPLELLAVAREIMQAGHAAVA